MTVAVSISVSHGVSLMKMSDFTIGTSAPGTGDVELRFNTSDTNSKNISHHEIIIMLKAFIRLLETGGPTAINLVPINSSFTTPPAV